jgi:hypothetical protein
MFTKPPFMVESFVIVGSFDCDCTHVYVLLLQHKFFSVHQHVHEYFFIFFNVQFVLLFELLQHFSIVDPWVFRVVNYQKLRISNPMAIAINLQRSTMNGNRT